MSICIQHCWLSYGSIMRGSRKFRQGGGEGSEKTLITFLRHQLFHSFKEGYQWFILNKTIFFFKVPEGVQHFTGEGVQIFPGVGGGGGK